MAFFRLPIVASGMVVILRLVHVSWDSGGKLKVVLILGEINSVSPAILYSMAAQVLHVGY